LEKAGPEAKAQFAPSNMHLCSQLYTIQQKELVNNTIELMNVLRDDIKRIFRLFHHVTQHLVHWAKDETNAVGTFPNPRKKKWY